jgi:hypothetical protein
MKNFTQQKKTIVVAAFMAVTTVSITSAPQAGALSLNEVLTGITSGIRQNQTTPTTTAPSTSPTTPNNSSSNDSKTTQTTTQASTQSRPNTQNLVPTIVETVTQQPTAPATQQPAQTVAPQSPAPAATTTNTTNNVAPARARAQNPAINTAAVRTIDTSAAVFTTANAQSVGNSSINNSPYMSNKLDPERAKQLFYIGIATIAAGVLIYAVTSLPTRKQPHRVPVKSV